MAGRCREMPARYEPFANGNGAAWTAKQDRTYTAGSLTGEYSMRLPTLMLCALTLSAPSPAVAEFARQILEELVESNTAPSGGNDMSQALGYLEGHLRAAGFDDEDLHVVAADGEAANLVVRLRSPQPERRPILLMAHLDVVEALRADWSVPPYELTEQDGYYYGRGTVDNKAGAAIIVATLVRLKQEGYRGDRDLVAMLTGDEETSGAGADWLATEGRELIDAEFALNSDGGFVILEGDRRTTFVVQTSEKVYVSFRLEALDPGGHSSLPRPDNPVYRIARTLADQQRHAFPIDLNDTTRAFFESLAPDTAGEERELVEALVAGDADDPVLARLPDYSYYNAQARTTCVATQIAGGHAENALPQTATAVINCRVLPQADPADVEAALRRIAAAHDVTLATIYPAKPSPPSPLTPHILGPIGDVAGELWPGIRLVPEMSTGATDGVFIRSAGIPVYGVSAIAEVPDELRAHGQDERILVESFDEAERYWYRLLRRMTD